MNKIKGQISLFVKSTNISSSGLTPLHVAASLERCEDVVDALTEDPGTGCLFNLRVGIEAWKKARDNSGLTHACLRGHYSYIHLVQRKLNKKRGKGHMVVDIPRVLEKNKKQKAVKYAPLESEKQCRQCEHKLVHARHRGSVNIYKPLMVSLVAIAAVCVCTALLFKSSPEVFCSLHPFRWELLKYGSQ